jgi:hypothetical protein
MSSETNSPVAFAWLRKRILGKLQPGLELRNTFWNVFGEIDRPLADEAMRIIRSQCGRTLRTIEELYVTTSDVP